MPLSKELLDILACPKCKGDIFLNKAGDGLICKPVDWSTRLKMISL